MGKIVGKPKGFADNFVRKPGSYPKVTHYCPGCGHGRIHKLIAEALETLDVVDKTVFVSPVGCSVFGYYYFDCGNIQAAHGRAPAVATGTARSNPESMVISYQGDGDLGAIGMAEIMHAANRGENMTVIFVNNGIYGMTGGQMAPTTLDKQVTSTTPYGRDISETGAPLKMSELISTLDAPVYVERVAVSDAKNIMKTKRAINKALQSQKDKKGFSFVEVLSTCPIGWKLSPSDAIDRLQSQMETYFPLKVFKDDTETRSPKRLASALPKDEDIINILGVNDETVLFKKDEGFIKNFKDQRVRVAGFGGQGVLMAGVTLAQLGMETGLNVTWLPSYGPEMRGGTANCHVVISNKPVGTPLVELPNVLIAMNSPSLDEFLPIVEKGGLVVVNSSIVTKKIERTDVKAVYVPMTDIAESLGLRAASNMVAVTAYLAFTGVMKLDQLKKMLEVGFKKKDLLAKNMEVIDKAYEYVKINCL